MNAHKSKMIQCQKEGSAYEGLWKGINVSYLGLKLDESCSDDVGYCREAVNGKKAEEAI